MRIEHLYRYPVKGFSAEALDDVVLRPGECLPDDRRFALSQGDSAFDPAAPAWVPKYHFACLMKNARLAKLHVAFDPRAHLLAIRHPDGPTLAAATDTAAGRAEIADYLTRFLGDEARGTPSFVEVPGHNFTDVATKAVSIIGLSSLHALEEAAGRRLDPLRFRANVYVSGGPPWWEFGLVGQDILLGGARLRVFKKTIRCPATEVDPITAERDANPPAWLRAHFGHAYLGVYAEVLGGGRIAMGDALEPVEPDLLR